jgi:hypothetical protein
MAAMACAGAVGAATAVRLRASPSGSCSVAASRSVAFRGAAVAVRPLRVCRRGQRDDGVEYLQRRMERLSVKASAEDGEGEVTLNKPMGSGKKVTGLLELCGIECGEGVLKGFGSSTRQNSRV